MEKRQAIEFLEYLRQDRNLEKTIYGDALNMAIEALKAQLSKEDTTSDLISRQAAVDAFEDTTFTKNEIRRRLSDLPPAQPEPSILLSWVEKYIEWLRSLDNEFANLAAAHISVMVKKWRDEQNERPN